MVNNIKVIGGEMSDEEVQQYVTYAKKKHPYATLYAIRIDGDDLILEYKVPPFERIRRITGYLVGTTERWNDAKLEELNDRVAHNMAI